MEESFFELIPHKGKTTNKNVCEYHRHSHENQLAKKQSNNMGIHNKKIKQRSDFQLSAFWLITQHPQTPH